VNPTRVHATNFRSYESLDLELPSGCVAIVGENGAGKSSLVSLVDLALFGPQSRSLADYVTEGEEDMEIGVEFEHRGDVYRVRRTHSKRGRGQSKLDFEKLEETHDEGGDWFPLTRETAAATQEAICELIGLSRETFRASAFLAQGDGAAFTEAQPRERKRILAEVLGLDVWDRLLECVRADKSVTEAELSRFAGQIEVWEHELAGRVDAVKERDASAVSKDEAAGRLEGTETELRALEERLGKAKEAQSVIDSAESLARARESALERLSARYLELGRLDEDIANELLFKPELARMADAIPWFEAQADDARAAANAATERERLSAELGAVVNKIAVASVPEEATCPTCGQHLHAEAKERALATLTEERDELERRLAELPEVGETRPLGNVEHDLRLAREAQGKLGRLEERESQRAGVQAELERLQEERPQLEGELVEVKARVAELRLNEQEPVAHLTGLADDLRARAEHWRSERELFDRAVARCDERLERLGKIEHELLDAKAQTEGKRKTLDLLALLERAFGRDGIPALIVENAAIPQIELEANRILDELGTPFSVELRTQRALKSGDGMKEALDVIVSDGQAERAYETFSGGERTRLNLALRIALARLLAHRRGAEVRMLAIDEPEFLDEAGHARLAEVLRGLLGDFDRVLLISHQAALRDAFDQVIAVVKENERSQIVEGQASDYLAVEAAA
jgi:exonuclease SbcC